MKNMKRFLLCLVSLLLVTASLAIAETAAGNTFTVLYHPTMEEGPSNYTSNLVYGASQQVTKIQDLGEEFAEVGRAFKGWYMYRESDDKWFVNNSAGTGTWVKLENGELPEGYTFRLTGNGSKVSTPAPAGTIVHLYGQWYEKARYTVEYYEDEDSEPSGQTTWVTYGVPTDTLTIKDLGYTQVGRVFTGWKAYRSYDDKWFATNTSGSGEWVQLTNGELPSGYSYRKLGNNVGLASTASIAPEGTVRLIAQWDSEGYTVFYHESEKSEASATVTAGAYGEVTKLETVDSLGFGTDTTIFWGWRIYKEENDSWLVRKDNQPDGDGVWKASSEIDGDTVFLLWRKDEVSGTFAKKGGVHFYAQWISTTIDVTDPIFKADGTDQEDDYEAIQKALSLAQQTDSRITVVVPAGTYYLSTVLKIYSNTELQADSKATLIRTNPKNLMIVNASGQGGNEGGYTRTSDIIVRGGIWDGKADGSSNTNLFFFTHASNVQVIGATLKNCDVHHLEMAAVKDSSIKNCTFRDYVLPTGTVASAVYGTDGSDEISMEAVQLDFADKTSSPASSPFDGTPCKNITVSGCSFINCCSGVGNHHAEGTGTGFTISGNTFTNTRNTCVNLYSLSGITVSNNTATNCYRFIRIISSKGTVAVKGNTVSSDGKSIPAKYGIEILNTTNKITISDGNSFDGFEHTIYASNSTADVIGNKIRNASKNGVTFSRSTGDIQGNDISSIGANGIYALATTGDITENNIASCGTYSIATYRDKEDGKDVACTGKIEKNRLDNLESIFNSGDMTLGENYSNTDTAQQIIRAEAALDSIVKSTEETFTVTTTTDLETLMLYAENGTSLVKSWEAKGNSKVSDNLRTWTVSAAIGGTGDRKLVFKAGTTTTTPVSNAVTVAFTVEASGVQSAARTYATIAAGVTEEFTVKTTKDITTLNVYDENGELLKSWKTDKNSTVSGSVRTWKVSLQISDAGNCTVTFRGSTTAGEKKSSRAASFTVEKTGVISVEVQDAILAKGGTEKFTVVTTGSAKYLMLYAENGTSLVQKWAASGNSKADGDNLVWNVGVAISGTGNRKLIFKAGTTTKPTAASQTAAFSVVAKKIVSAAAGYDAIAKGAEQEFTVVTTSDLQNLILYAENGTSVVKKWAASGNSTVSNKMRTWKVKVAISGTGDRKLVFKAGTTTTTPVSNKVTVPFTVEANGVISAARTYATIAAGGTEEFTVKTTKDIKKLSVYTEKGSLLKSWDAAKNSTVSGSVRTWKVSQKISAAGNRTFTFRGSTTAGETKSFRPVSFTVGDTGVISAKVKNSVLAKGAEQTFTVTTTGNAKYLMIYAEGGTSPVKKWAASGNSKADGSNLVWTVKLAITGAGDRKMTFKAGKTTSPAAPAKTVTFSVVDKKIVSAVATYDKIAKGGTQEFTVVTTATLKTLMLYAENGTSLVTSWKADGNSTVSNGMRTWKVTAKIAGAGNRKLVFKAGTTTTTAVSNKVTVPFTVE